MLALVAVGLAACSGGDDPTKTPAPSTRTQSGLSVAFAMQAGQRAQDRSVSGDKSTGSAAAPGSETVGDSTARSAGSLSYSIGNDGLTVTGYGMATADADSAILELYFSTTSTYPKPTTGSSGSSSDGSVPPESQDTPTTTGISEADLQPVIEELTGAGVDRADITFVGGSYYDPYYASATLRVTVKDIGNLGDLMKAASDWAAGPTDVYLQGNYVSYTISDCAALEASAMSEAAKDADSRSKELATAISVTRGQITGASSDAYSPFGGTACSGGYVGPYPVGGVTYAEGQPSQVQVYATVSVTYAIQ
jgi:uncharacterized protein YggE